MGCDCTKAKRRDSTPSTEPFRLTVIHERAAMCHFCPQAEHGPSLWRDGALLCGVSGLPIIEHLTQVRCPLSRHPDGAGITVWLGLRWYGVPFPLRVALWAFGATHRRPGVWGGCGCLVWIKSILLGPNR